jgi:hypothetical protein
MPPPKGQAALLGGVFIGVLSALPIISAGNLCCCLWVIAGGVLAAYILQQNHPEPITLVDGAAAGFLAGIAGAFVYMVVSVPFSLLLAPVQRRLLERLIERAPEMSGDLRDAIGQVSAGIAGIVIGFVVMLIIGMIFATLGGLLGAALFRREPPPVPPPSSHPPLTTEVLPPSDA